MAKNTDTSPGARRAEPPAGEPDETLDLDDALSACEGATEATARPSKLYEDLLRAAVAAFPRVDEARAPRVETALFRLAPADAPFDAGSHAACFARCLHLPVFIDSKWLAPEVIEGACRCASALAWFCGVSESDDPFEIAASRHSEALLSRLLPEMSRLLGLHGHDHLIERFVLPLAECRAVHWRRRPDDAWDLSGPLGDDPEAIDYLLAGGYGRPEVEGFLEGVRLPPSGVAEALHVARAMRAALLKSDALRKATNGTRPRRRDDTTGSQSRREAPDPRLLSRPFLARAWDSDLEPFEGRGPTRPALNPYLACNALHAYLEACRVAGTRRQDPRGDCCRALLSIEREATAFFRAPTTREFEACVARAVAASDPTAPLLDLLGREERRFLESSLDWDTGLEKELAAFASTIRAPAASVPEAHRAWFDGHARRVREAVPEPTESERLAHAAGAFRGAERPLGPLDAVVHPAPGLVGSMPPLPPRDWLLRRLDEAIDPVWYSWERLGLGRLRLTYEHDEDFGCLHAWGDPQRRAIQGKYLRLRVRVGVHVFAPEGPEGEASPGARGDLPSGFTDLATLEVALVSHHELCDVSRMCMEVSPGYSVLNPKCPLYVAPAWIATAWESPPQETLGSAAIAIVRAPTLDEDTRTAEEDVRRRVLLVRGWALRQMRGPPDARPASSDEEAERVRLSASFRAALDDLDAISGALRLRLALGGRPEGFEPAGEGDDPPFDARAAERLLEDWASGTEPEASLTEALRDGLRRLARFTQASLVAVERLRGDVRRQFHRLRFLKDHLRFPGPPRPDASTASSRVEEKLDEIAKRLKGLEAAAGEKRPERSSYCYQGTPSGFW